ncbi:hypothetical protein LguiA_006967 [Lonicera macranthoides]
MAGNYGDRSLEETPTWAVATVCAVIVVISFLIELGIHSLGKARIILDHPTIWFQKRRNKAMIEALEKMKTELMIMGFISLLLVVATSYIAKICIPVKVGHTMLPCRKDYMSKKKEDDYSDDDARKLLSYSQDMIWGRLLAEANYKDYCGAKAKVSSNILHYKQKEKQKKENSRFGLINFMDVIKQMKKWKAWELETSSLEYQFRNDPARFRFAHQTSFVRRHTGFSTTPGIRWIDTEFSRMMEVIVDTSLGGNKTRTCDHGDGSTNPRSGYRCQVSHLITIHTDGYDIDTIHDGMCIRLAQTLFTLSSEGYVTLALRSRNAFQMAYFLWAVYEFGIKSCLHENLIEVVLRVCFGLAIHIMCSYITFPLYALVTQMGSNMKQSIFEEQTAKALKKWRKAARESKKLGNADEGENTPSRTTSPVYLLHRYRSSTSAVDSQSVGNPSFVYQSDIHAPTPEQTDYPEIKEESPGIGFTFGKP